MKKLLGNKKGVIGLVLVAIIVVGAVLMMRTDNKGILVNNYVHPETGKPMCRAYAPECGVCPGTVIDKQCYVKSDKNAKVPKGYTRVENFNSGNNYGICMGIMPECGDCTGIILNDECYVKE